MIRIIAGVFLELVRSWEFIAAAAFLMLAIPFIFYIASFKPPASHVSITEKVRKAKAKRKVKDVSGENDPEQE